MELCRHPRRVRPDYYPFAQLSRKRKRSRAAVRSREILQRLRCRNPHHRFLNNSRSSHMSEARPIFRPACLETVVARITTVRLDRMNEGVTSGTRTCSFESLVPPLGTLDTVLRGWTVANSPDAKSWINFPPRVSLEEHSNIPAKKFHTLPVSKYCSTRSI